MLICHGGSAAWSIPTDFRSLFPECPEFASHISDFSYLPAEFARESPVIPVSPCLLRPAFSVTPIMAEHLSLAADLDDQIVVIPVAVRELHVLEHETDTHVVDIRHLARVHPVIRIGSDDGEQWDHHSADYNPADFEVSLSELLRVIL